MNQACAVVSSLLSEDRFYLAILGFFNLVLFFSAGWLVIKLKDLLKKWLVILFSVSIFIIGNLGLLFLFIYIDEYYFGPIANIYFPVNAAIKNTCYLDPTQQNCPNSVEGIINIDNQKFKPLLHAKKVSYTRDPQTNIYTLIIHHSPLKAVIFDPRLSNMGNYGFDFVDVFNNCGPIPASAQGNDDSAANRALRQYTQQIWPTLDKVHSQ